MHIFDSLFTEIIENKLQFHKRTAIKTLRHYSKLRSSSSSLTFSACTNRQMNAANAACSESFGFSLPFHFGFRACMKTGSNFKAYFI